MSRRAFTLIELLIVVAIIAILAAIAVPNFLEAQVRAKISRARSDMRSLATAVEAYRVSENRYPREGAPNTCNLASDGLPELTTPVAYLSSYPDDSFAEKGCRRAPLLYGVCTSGSPYHYTWSIGPDLENQFGTLLYDATNGTASQGDLKRSTAHDEMNTNPQ